LETPRADLITPLFISQHLSVALLLALKRRYGPAYDDLPAVVRRAQMTGVLLGAESPSYEFSCVVHGIVLMETSRLESENGEYVEALHHLAMATRCLFSDQWHTSLDEEFVERVIEDVFLHVRDAPWQQVADDCAALADLEEVVHHSEDRFFRNLAHAASGRAEERLTSSERSTRLNRREDEQAERRLKAYFFWDTWQVIPIKAWAALIDADCALNHTRGRFDSVLTHLQIATQELCFPIFWEPLVVSNRGARPRDVQLLVDGLRGKSPTVSTFARLARSPAFKIYVERLDPLSREDKDFLNAEFADRLQSLARSRNLVDHEPGKSQSRSDVTSLFANFLGIGRTGVLPCLARVHQAFQDSRPPKAGSPDIEDLQRVLAEEGITWAQAVRRLRSPLES
jgi:hypothetical protein